METAGQQVTKIETRLRQLGAKLDRMAAKAAEAGAEVKLDYRKEIDHAKEKHAAVHSKLAAFRAANGQKWDAFKGGIESAWHDLDIALKALRQEL